MPRPCEGRVEKPSENHENTDLCPPLARAQRLQSRPYDGSRPRRHEGRSERLGRGYRHVARGLPGDGCGHRGGLRPHPHRSGCGCRSVLDEDEGTHLVVRRGWHRRPRDLRSRHGALGHRGEGERRAARRPVRPNARHPTRLREPSRQSPDDRGQRRGHPGLHRRRISFCEARARQAWRFKGRPRPGL